MTIADLGPYPHAPGHEKAVALDEEDPLRDHRDRYVDDDPDLIYLDGNSLGRLPLDAITTIEDVAGRQWGRRLIRSWNEGWWDLQTEIGDQLAPLIGARRGEVIISDSTTVNLYKLAFAAMADASPDRSGVVTDDLNFPSDIYVLDGLARQHGGQLTIARSNGVDGPVEEIVAAIDAGTALVSLSHTTFKSGYTYDMSAVTAAAHQAGARILWDCSHSVGVVPIDLEADGVDFAVGCTYKYLNGGPGSPAFLYVRESLQDDLANPIAGWWGHTAPFAFDLDFEPTHGIRRFHSGTMPILSLAPIAAGVADVMKAGIDVIRAKSMSLSEFLIELAESQLEPLGFRLASPADSAHRGSHVSLAHDLAWPINRALIELARVIPDFRTPDTIRLGLAPLYVSHVDVHTAIQRIIAVVTEGMHDQFIDSKAVVT